MPGKEFPFGVLGADHDGIGHHVLHGRGGEPDLGDGAVKLLIVRIGP